MSKNDPLDLVIASTAKPENSSLTKLYKGPLQIGETANIWCYNATDGKTVHRLVAASSFMQLVGMDPYGSKNMSVILKLIGAPPVSGANAKLIAKLKSPLLLMDDNVPVPCYEDSVVINFCTSVLRARKAKKFDGPVLLRYADYCESFISGLASVGLAALIDEATGYINEKKRTEYRDMFREFIRNAHSEWVKEFPAEFFDGIYNLYAISKISHKNHPQFFGKFILKYVYMPLASSQGAILAMLDEKDPIVNGKGRRYKLHQFLSDNIGKSQLRNHLSGVCTLLRISHDKGHFRRLFKKAYPQSNDQLEFDFDDDEI